MKNKLSVTLILTFFLLNTNAFSNIYTESKEVVSTDEDYTSDVNYSEQYAIEKNKRIIKKLSIELGAELEQIENTKERRVVENLIKKLNNSSSSTHKKEALFLNYNLKNTIHLLVDRLTSPHAIISIAISITTCALRGILTSSIALEMIHELVSAFKWDVMSKLSFQIASLIPLFYGIPIISKISPLISKFY